MIINDREELCLDDYEATALGTGYSAISLAEVAFKGMYCPWERTRTLEAGIARARRKAERHGWLASMAPIDPTGNVVRSLARDIDTVHEIAAKVGVYELETAFSIPHEPAPEVTYGL